MLTANSRYAAVWSSDQRKMDIAMKNMKNDAAKLGANGIILSGIGDSIGGTVGMANTYGSTSYGYGAPIQIKSASGMAVYVTP